MEEDTGELFDYLRVIWKRRIFIIVVTLVSIGIGVGVAVKNSRLNPPPTSYIANAVIRIGKKLVLTPTLNIASTTTAFVENSEDLKDTIPHRYGLNIDEASGYHLEVQQIGKLSMLKLTLKGSDEGVKKVLKGIIDTLVSEHRRITKASIVAYTSFIKKLEADAEMFQDNMIMIEESIREIKRREGVYMNNMAETAAKTAPKTRVEKHLDDRTSFLMVLDMLYLKTLDKQRDLNSNRKHLRNTHWQLILYKTTIGNLVAFDTELLGKVKSTTIIPIERKRPIVTISVAGFAGLIMSLFIVFFLEYIEESRLKRKGK